MKVQVTISVQSADKEGTIDHCELDMPAAVQVAREVNGIPTIVAIILTEEGIKANIVRVEPGGEGPVADDLPESTTEAPNKKTASNRSAHEKVDSPTNPFLTKRVTISVQSTREPEVTYLHELVMPAGVEVECEVDGNPRTVVIKLTEDGLKATFVKMKHDWETIDAPEDDE